MDADAHRRGSRSAWALAGLLLVVVGPLVQVMTAQPGVRFAQTAALVEHRTLELDRYGDTLLVDRVEHRGHVYSDKAPLQAFLAVPVYAVGRAVGMESAAVERPTGNLGLWWVTLWSATIPAAALVVLVHRACRRVAPAGATLATAGVAFGTLLLPFAGELYGHVLCALLAFAAWTLVDEGGGGPWRLVAAGALTGAAVATEYPMALVAVVLAVAVLAVRGVRALLPFVAGGAPFAAGVMAYQWAAFGGPFTDPYRLKPQLAGSSPAVTGMPRPGQAVEVLLGARGLFVFAPVTALALGGLVLLWRRGPTSARPTAAVGLAVFAALWALQAGWANPWGGEMPGPRYLIPALPFLAPGLALVAERVPRAVVVATAWGVVAMAGPLLTLHLVPDGGATGVSHLDTFATFGAAPALPVLALGRWGWLLYVAAVVVALVWTARRVAAEHADETAPEPAVPADA